MNTEFLNYLYNGQLAAIVKGFLENPDAEVESPGKEALQATWDHLVERGGLFEALNMIRQRR